MGSGDLIMLAYYIYEPQPGFYQTKNPTYYFVAIITVKTLQNPDQN